MLSTNSTTVARLLNWLVPSAIAASVVYTIDNSLFTVPVNPTALVVEYLLAL